jgi:class 3 adenylate cyclase
MVTDRALDDPKFNTDPYITGNKIRSALCLPLFHQNDLLAIIYLENNVVYGAFSPHRLEFLKLLSGQIAIAIKNASLYQNLTEAYDQQVQLKDAYSKFVPMDFLNFLGKDSILDIKLGDQIQEVVTVMFIDIVDYTSMSEKMTPKENFDFINGSLRRLGPALRKYGGVISQFMGDGAMAIFKDEPDKALLAGIEMQKTLHEYNLERQPKDRKPIRIGVGIHTGKVMLGIIGEQMRMDQNVISDAVNIASRVQDLTRVYDTRIMLTGTSKSMLKNSTDFTIRNLGKTSIKGRKKRIEIYECLDGLEENQIRLKVETGVTFNNAINQYYKQQYDVAIAGFEKVIRVNPYDKAAILYIQWSKEAQEKEAMEAQNELDN